MSRAASGSSSFYAAELRLFGGLALAWLLGFALFWLDRRLAGALLPTGVLTMLLECLLEACIIASLWLSPRRRGAGRWFLWFFCLLFPADLGYLVLHYALGRTGENWLNFLLTTLPYSMAYVLGSVGLFRHIRPRLADMPRLSFAWLPLLMLVPAVSGVLLPLAQALHRTGGWSFELSSIAFNSAFAAVFFFWSAVTLLMSRDRVFPFVGLAGIVTQLGNWEGNSIYLRQRQAFGFGEYEFLWLCGIIVFWYAFVVVARAPAATAAGPDDERRPSLVLQQRMIVLGLLSLALILAAALPGRDAWSYRLVFFGMAAGAAVALLVGELLARQIVHYATLFGKAVDLTGRDESAEPPGREIPVELWDVYRRAFQEDMLAQRTKAAVRRDLAELAAQVAHDIRSPLAALDCVAKDVPGIPEEKRVIIRSAAGRIHDIANDLLDRNRVLKAAGPAAKELLSSHIALLVSEKRLQFRSRLGVSIESRLDSASYGLFAVIPPAEFKRVLSNLINNSVEALGEKGAVEVRLCGEGGRIRLTVSDDGKGIAPEVLARLGGRGETHGKAAGSGLGLAHAKASAAAWGGSLELSSELGRGTTAAILLPRAEPPDWFVSRLELAPRGAVVALDDDTSIHQVWQGRFDSLRARDSGIEVLHFSTPGAVRGWAKDNPEAARGALYLLDYELGGQEATGLDLAAELGIGERAILVTSRFEEEGILAGCRRLKMRLLPKGLAGFVPMAIAEERPRSPGPDAALLDDDPLVRLNWKTAARAKGLDLAVFAEASEFLAAAEAWPKGTALYLDSKLGHGLRGEDIAESLHARGFTELYLATGYDPEDLPARPWLKGVVGKSPPWA